MRRVLILGPGASGKSTLATRLGERAGIPVVHLDDRFWNTGLAPTAPEEWARLQRELTAPPAWILDGDLGPYDQLEVRLELADTVIVLDVSRWRCAWRALRRSRERADFWRWLLTWRKRYRPRIMKSVARRGGGVDVRVLRTPAQIEAFVQGATRRSE